LKPKVRGLVLERIAREVLEGLGFEVLEERKRVEREGIEVAEVDMLAERGGELYAVEVKAGKISVADVRQAYANAVLLGAKPLLVCRGIADESAKVLAEELGVEILKLSDYVMISTPEEVRSLMLEAVVEALAGLLESVLEGLESDIDPRVLEAVAKSRSIGEASARARLEPRELATRLREAGMKLETPCGTKSYSWIKLQAMALYLSRRLAEPGAGPWAGTRQRCST